MDIDIRPVGACGALAVLGSRISETTGARVAALEQAVHRSSIAGIIETVPAFASLLVRYDPLRTDYDGVSAALYRLAEDIEAENVQSGRTVEIPVCYGGAYGEDLPAVAWHAGLSEEEVIRLHSGRTYRIYMLGFLPGFPYLGGLDERLFTPRLPTPRTRIPAGSVGIGGEQTGIYPMESPGGWQLIGRTPLCLSAPGRALPYAAGDSIRFVPIDAREFERIAAREREGCA